MENAPVLKAKLTIPEIPKHALMRGCIKQIKLSAYRLTMIAAPAGYGKTTAVILALGKDRDAAVWYRLEREDQHPQVFYAHLIEALFGYEPLGDSEAYRYLLHVDTFEKEYSMLNAVICHDLCSRQRYRSQPVFLVFDDFHNVIECGFIKETLEYFAENLPDNMHLVVLSRTKPELRIGRLLLRNEVLFLDMAYLRFTREETERLISGIYKYKIGPEAITAICDCSEGWIAGIILLLYTYRPEAEISGALSSVGDPQQAFLYLLTEALRGSPGGRLETLVRISILPEFSGEMLADIFRLEHTEALIDELVENNVFIQKTVGWDTTYRFHSLFQNALISLLPQTFSRQEIRRDCLMAADFYLSTGQFPLYIRFLLRAGETSKALEASKAEGLRLMNTGELDAVPYLLQEFPDDLVQSDPYLLLFRGTSLMNIQFQESYRCLCGALSAFGKLNNTRLQMNVLGLTIATLYKKNDLQPLRAVFRLIPKIRAIFTGSYERKTLLLCLYMSLAWSDHFPLHSFLRRKLDRLGISEPIWAYLFELTKLGEFYRIGALETAGSMARQLLRHPTSVSSDSWRVAVLSLYHNVSSQYGDLAAARSAVSELELIAEKYDSAYAGNSAARFDAYNQYQSGKPDRALEIISELTQAYRSDGHPIMACIVTLTKCMWESERNPSEKCVAEAEAALEGLLPLKAGQGLPELGMVLLACVLKETDEKYCDRAEKLLKRAYGISKRKKAELNQCGAALQLADLYYRKNDEGRETRFLTLFANTAARAHYVYFREMTYSALVRTAARCAEKGIQVNYMRALLTGYLGHENERRAAEDYSRLAAAPKAFLAGCFTSDEEPKPVCARLFGQFKLTAGGKDIPGGAWKTRKISGILQYILASSGKAVSRETLTAAFWPESDAKAAGSSLRVALYELKKALAEYGMSFSCDDSLICEDKNGFYISSRYRLQTDAGTFSELYKTLEKGGVSPQEEQALLEEMVGLYTGDYLEGELDDALIVLSREYYKSVFTETSHRLIRLYLDSGENGKAEAQMLRHLTADPFDERACGELIALYGKTERKNQAASLRRQFSRRFSAEFGVEPEFK
jgi:DNA-binding SARP family transcriptional activator